MPSGQTAGAAMIVKRPTPRGAGMPSAPGWGEGGDVPTTAQGLDQQHGGRQPPAADLDRGRLIGQGICLRGDHVSM